jgi:hypothetical protein
MSDKKIDDKIENLDAKKVTVSLLTKLGSGVCVLGIIGYAASWAFVTLNTLQEGVAKNTEKLEMIEKGVKKDREDKAQWKQIMIMQEKAVDNEVEIRVLKELYKIRTTSAVDKANPTPDSPAPAYGPYVNPMLQSVPMPPALKNKKRVDDLYRKLIERDKKKLETIDDFKRKSIQQIQEPPIQRKGP